MTFITLHHVADGFISINDDSAPFVIAPFVHQTANLIRAEDRVRQFVIPDVKPSVVPLSGKLQNQY